MMIRGIFKITFTLLFILLLISADQNGNELCKENRLVLSPVELIDLVIEERNKKHLQGGHNKKKKIYVLKEGKESATELNEGNKTMNTRKVWSRWNKWGQCSVTCGLGTISRQRLCVAGRCAPGEREEQRRPCTRAPCAAPLDNIPQELHELD